MSAVQANLLRQQVRSRHPPRPPTVRHSVASYGRCAPPFSCLIWQVRSLLAALRPEAVALVDAWDYSDYELNSALGRYDGRATARD